MTRPPAAVQPPHGGPSRRPQVYIADSGGGDGQRFGPDGRLYAVAGKAKVIVAYESPEKRAEVATGFRGNDLVVAHNGGIYVTDPFETPNNSKVYYIGPKGGKKVVDTALRFANGITLSPDQTLLYVENRGRWYTAPEAPKGKPGHGTMLEPTLHGGTRDRQAEKYCHRESPPDADGVSYHA